MENDTQLLPAPILIFTYVITMTLIVLGNSLVILVVTTRRHMKSTTNIFICSLSVADLLIALLVIPSSIHENLDHYISNPYQCRVVPFVQLMSISASIFSLVAMGADRFRAIAQPSKPTFTIADAMLGVSLVWGLAVLYAARTFLPDFDPLQDAADEDDDSEATPGGVDGQDWRTDRTSTMREYVLGRNLAEDKPVCNILVEEAVGDVFYRIADFLFIFLIPMLILFVLYALIIVSLNSSKTHTGLNSTSKRKRRIVKMCVAVVLAFFLCWAPYHITEVSYDVADYISNDRLQGTEEEDEEGESLGTFRFLTVIIALANSLMSPVIYAFFSRQFRHEMAEVLRGKLRRTAAVSPSGTSTVNSRRTATCSS